MNTHAIRSTLIGSLGMALALASASALAISFRITDLGTLGGPGSDSFGADLNDSRQVTGRAESADGLVNAFLWDGTRMRDLALPTFLLSFGVAINESGQVAGEAVVPGPNAHAFLWDGTRTLDLGSLVGPELSSRGHAINDSGQVTGESDAPGVGGPHAFLWNGTAMLDLGTLGGGSSQGVAINASGQVTGSSDGHAFLWDGTTMQDLNALIDPADPLQPFVTLIEGVEINDLGQILANGRDSRTGEDHAYVLTSIGTVPELALLGLGLAGLGFTRRRRAA